MSYVLKIARRAAAASPDEWRCRARQALYTGRNWLGNVWGGAAVSRHGYLRALGLRPEELAAWWRSRSHSLLDLRRDAAWRELADGPESELPWVVAQAELVVRGLMPLFSHPPLDFQGPERWHTDFILGRTAPRKFAPWIRYLDVHQVGDSKHVWEPNRFAWAVWLGIAHRITAAPRFADKFLELTDDWFDQNPYPRGINYCSALEVAIRNYAWIWSLDLFADVLSEQPATLGKLLGGVWTGCRHIESNLSTYFSPNTHLTGEAFALLASGAAIPEFAQAARWRRIGQTILEQESRRQFHRDGTHRELSTGYHIYSTDFYLHAAIIGRRTGFRVSELVEQTAFGLAQRVGELAPLEWILPSCNDCDGGRLTQLTPKPLDAAPSLLAAELLDPEVPLVDRRVPRRGYPLLLNPGTALGGRRGQRSVALRATPRDESAGRCDSGLVAYGNAAGDYLLFRAGPFGYDACPHSHDAPLGVVLHLAACPVFVDNGVGSYTQDLAVRNAFRGALGKNTVLVDGHGPSLTDGWFSWRKTTDSRLVEAARLASGFRAAGAHAGYTIAGEFPVLIHREVMMLDAGIVAIVDRWDAEAEMTVQSRFTIHPDLAVDAARQLLHPREASTKFHYYSTSLSGRAPRVIHDQIPYSSAYGRHDQTYSLAFELDGTRRDGMVTLLSRIGGIHRTAEGRFEVGDADGTSLQLIDGRVEITPANPGDDSQFARSTGSLHVHPPIR